MDFDLTEEQKSFRNAFRKFAEVEIAPLVEEAEEEEKFPIQLLPKMGRLGYLCPRYSERYGGAGVDKLTEILLREELSRICQGVAAAWSGQSYLGTIAIYNWGTEEQKQKYIVPVIKGEKIAAFACTEPNAGSDVKSIESRAQKDGSYYVINGTKMFVSMGTICDFVNVIAYTDRDKGYRGISIFVVDKGTHGFTVGRKLRKEGVRCCETAELVFQDCRIPKENLVGQEGSFTKVMEILSEGRIGVAGNLVGIAQAGYEAALKYSKERIQFGQPIGKFQAIAFKLADMATEIDAARFLVYRAAFLLDKGREHTKEASMAKLFASEVAERVTRGAMNIHGGYGQMREFPVGRFHRDALAYVIGEGTPEIQRQIIAKRIWDEKP